MRLLVLGGGGFLGFHAVAAALATGAQVSVLSRSGSSPHEDVEVLHGDRTGDPGVLRGRQWDAVLDTFTDPSPGAPAVRATAELLSGSVGVYGYVSGMSRSTPRRVPTGPRSAPRSGRPASSPPTTRCRSGRWPSWPPSAR